MERRSLTSASWSTTCRGIADFRPAHAAGAVEQTIASYFERVNADDIEGVAALFTGEATVRAPGFPSCMAAPRLRGTTNGCSRRSHSTSISPRGRSNRDRSRQSTLTSVRRWELAAQTAFQALDVFECMPTA